MIGWAILGVTLGLPLLVGVLFRVSAPHLFFSVMAGDLLARYFGHDLGALPKVIPSELQTSYGEIALFVIPLLLSAFFLRQTISKNKLVLHLLPLAITGAVFGAFVLPLLPPNLHEQVIANPAGDWLVHLNRVIIGGVVIFQLIALWLLNNRRVVARRERKD